ncbi:MAG: hypothetical protein ACYCOU_13620 [Sulfobacillus sp.]
MGYILGIQNKSLRFLNLPVVFLLLIASMLGGCATTLSTPPPPPPACDGNPKWCISVVVEPGWGGQQTGLLGGLLFYVDGVSTVLNNPGETTIEVLPGNHIVNYCLDHEGLLFGHTKCAPVQSVNIISNYHFVIPGPP